MRAVRSTRKLLGKMLLIVGGSLLAATAAIAVVLYVVPPVEGLWVLPVVFGVQGVVWFLVGAIIAAKGRRDADNLERLKSEGLRFEGKVESVLRDNRHMRLGNSVTGFIECSYQNHEGRTCLVRSASFFLDDFNADYRATVYVNRSNPADYAVEISTGDEQDKRYDYDYRGN